jgi:hypothetical protein
LWRKNEGLATQPPFQRENTTIKNEGLARTVDEKKELGHAAAISKRKRDKNIGGLAGAESCG